MDSKQAIIARFTPRAALTALTPQAAAAVSPSLMVDGMVGIRSYPFRVGRESRGKVVDGVFYRVERPQRVPGSPTNNDLYLVDAGAMLQISREHFLIERTATGYQVVDRGSVCGVAVGGVRIGGEETGGAVPLRDGDEIQVGTEVSPYRYIFTVLE
jgi:pSer/pThr/pTyr-binding forkhead associated (FHA) protein